MGHWWLTREAVGSVHLHLLGPFEMVVDSGPVRLTGRGERALVTVLAFEMQAAVGTSLLVITTNSLASLASLATRSGAALALDWAVIGPFIGAAILGAWDGKRLAAKVSAPRLQRLFAVVLLAVAAFMLGDALT